MENKNVLPPRDGPNTPFKIDHLESFRLTWMEFEDGTTREVNDDWHPSDATRECPSMMKWKGETVFQKRKMPPLIRPDPRPQEAASDPLPTLDQIRQITTNGKR